VTVYFGRIILSSFGSSTFVKGGLIPRDLRTARLWERRAYVVPSEQGPRAVSFVFSLCTPWELQDIDEQALSRRPLPLRLFLVLFSPLLLGSSWVSVWVLGGYQVVEKRFGRRVDG
jgi:hypothetical protein